MSKSKTGETLAEESHSPRRKGYYLRVKEVWKGTRWTRKVLLAKLLDAGWRHDAITKPIESTIRGWLAGRKNIPEDAVEFLFKVLGGDLPKDAEAVKQIYGEEAVTKGRYKVKATSSESGIMRGPLEESLSLIDKEIAHARAHIDKASALTHDAYRQFGESHFAIGSTLTETPLVFGHSQDNLWIKNRFGAIARGLLYALIVPDDRAVEPMGKIWMHPIVASKYVESFEIFRSNLLEHLTGSLNIPEDQARYIAHANTQLFPVSSMPLTPPGGTLSLIGEKKNMNDVLTRMAMRPSFGITTSLQIWPALKELQHSMERWVLTVLATEESRLVIPKVAGKKQPADDKEAKWRLEFIDRLMKRMQGKAEPSRPFPLSQL